MLCEIVRSYYTYYACFSSVLGINNIIYSPFCGFDPSLIVLLTALKCGLYYIRDFLCSQMAFHVLRVPHFQLREVGVFLKKGEDKNIFL